MRYFLSALFPSWAFFIEPGPSVRLEYFAEGYWHLAIEPISRSWTHLLFNPDAGYLHAANNAVDHLLIAASSLTDNPQIENLPEYEIVRQLAKEADRSATRFRILARDEVVFQSKAFA